ncbi:ABC transporter permease [Microbacterium sediminis]|uniref:Transport permease protein n=1 Tax=Microbacterium sediminis TaxID=904291 RepID=A0A1B9NDQ1_9MICO|nr:ABC transporter permease [Microbacterium sediminis]OCG74710.1 ABC transporter [Microbacterium sediminis]QBR75007.1 ABC transporter permease [Microbacterium sediminis]
MSGTIAHPGLDELREEALAWGRKPRARGTWYVAEHMLRAMRAYGWTIVVGSFGQPILYLLGLAVGLAALIQVPISDGGRDVPYLLYVAPALLMTAAINVASEEFTYPVLAGFKWRRYFYGFNASPLSSRQIAVGVVVGAGARMILTLVLYMAFVLAFFASLHPGATQVATAWLMAPIGLFGGLAYGSVLLAYAGSIEDDRGQLQLIQRFIFMPMFLFSGTFYPLATLPLWLQWIGWVSPLWHASELGRMVAYGKPAEAGMVAIHLGYLGLLTIGGLWLAGRVFTKRLAS